MPPNSLPRHQRLLKPKQFKAVYSNRQFGNSDLFTFNVLGTNVLETNEPLSDEGQLTGDVKLGVTVSKKVSKKAVERNRIKRQVKEFFRIRKTEVDSVYLVITAKPASGKATNAEIQESLQELWLKVLKWQRWFVHQQVKVK